MKKYGLPFIALLLLLVVAGVSCKKSGNSDPFGSQKIATIIKSGGGDTLHYRIVYDAYNNVDSMVYTGAGAAAGTYGYLAFSYIGSSFTITDQTGYSYMVDGNTNGQIFKVFIADTINLTYTGSQLSEVSVFTPTTTPPYSATANYFYTWANGDVSTIKSSATTQTYTYQSGKNGQPGDAIRINYFLTYGQSPVKTNLLPVTLTNSSTQGENYYYTYDSQGRISSLTEVSYDNSTIISTDTTVLAYTYY